MSNLRREAELLLADGYKLLARTSDLDCDPEVRSRRLRDGYLRLAEAHQMIAASEEILAQKGWAQWGASEIPRATSDDPLPSSDDDREMLHGHTPPRGFKTESLALTEAAIETCAHAAHEMNRVYCLSHGDDTQVPWEEAPDWQKESCIKVRGVLAGNGPAESHASWLVEKKATGWKYGPVKDADKKEHPCMLPYEELPEFQRRKDELFVATVKAIAAAMKAG